MVKGEICKVDECVEKFCCVGMCEICLVWVVGVVVASYIRCGGSTNEFLVDVGLATICIVFQTCYLKCELLWMYNFKEVLDDD